MIPLISDPGFWKEQAQRVDWMTPFTEGSRRRFHFLAGQDNWFADGALNVSATVSTATLNAPAIKNRDSSGNPTALRRGAAYQLSRPATARRLQNGEYSLRRHGR